jgi:hypothetical protein
MPRIKHQIQEEHLFEIKSLVEYTFGRKILNTNDCSDLSNNIFEKEKSPVSIDTLRRLFGLVETKTQPSLFTLEILSKYVGFSGYYDFINSVVLVGKHFFYKQVSDCISNKKEPFEVLESLRKTKPCSDYYSIFHQLILLAYQKNDNLFFEQVFVNQPGFEWNSVFKYEIYQSIQLLGKLVEENKWLQEIAYKNYIGLPFYFDYFVEWYVADEQPYYVNLLHRYSEIHQKNAKKQIFYHCILSIPAFRNNDFDKFEQHYQQLLKLEKNIIPNNVLESRLLGVHFIKNQMIDIGLAENKLFDIDFERHYPDIGDRVTSLFFLFNYLFEAKAYNIMVRLFERWLTQDTIFFSIWARINWNQLCVYMTYAYLNQSELIKAKIYQNQIDTSLFEVYNNSRFQLLFDNIKLS